MIVKSTEIKNNFGRYLKLLDKESIIITRNGNPVAKIEKYKDFDNFSEAKEVSGKYKAFNHIMTYKEFVEFSKNSEERYEYIDGEAYLLASPGVTHQLVVGNLYAYLHAWFKGKECTPFISPFDVMLKKDENDINVVQPDILVACDSQNKNEEDKYTGVPTLTIEVLSESTKSKDIIKKLELYMQSGIKEYWIVDYFNKSVFAYEFENKDIKNIRSFAGEDMLSSFAFDGLSIKLDDVFENI